MNTGTEGNADIWGAVTYHIKETLIHSYHSTVIIQMGFLLTPALSLPNYATLPDWLLDK